MDKPKIASRRQEAGTFLWTELTDKQRNAVCQVANMIRDAIDSLDQGKSLNSSGNLRRSQLAFVDGDRGTGKTSVLLKVRDLTTDKSELIENGLPPDVEFIHRNRNRICWLETLDMEPLRKDTNLFAAILARLEAVSGRQTPSRSPMSGAIDEFEAYDQYLSDLSNLQNDVVLAWDRNTSKRGDQLEPHAYAAEVLRTERAGLQINERLTKVLDQLAKLYARPSDKDNPLFILPVDDFDLAPTRCLEMMRLIRAISTPRLFFLMCGSTRLAQVALILQNEGELASMVQGVAQREYEWESLIRPTGIEIAANNIRKLLPPEQRAVLPALGLEEALQLKLDSSQTTLRSVLKSLTFDVNSNPTNTQRVTLESFLLLDNRWPIKSCSAAEFLGGTPRQIHDIGKLLERREGCQADWGVELLGALSEALQREINEDWSLTGDQREVLCQTASRSFDNTFRLSERLKPKFRWLNSAGLRETHSASYASISQKAPRQPSASLIKSTLDKVDLSLVELDLEFYRESEMYYERERLREFRRRRAIPPLSPRIAGGLKFLHDLALSLWGGYLATGSIIRSIAGSPSSSSPDTWMSTAVQFSKRKLYLPWPTPVWTSFRQVECFTAIWSTISKDYGSMLGMGWLESILRIVCDEPFASPQPSYTSTFVAEACKKLVNENPSREMRKTLRHTTLAAIAEFCAPEYGAINASEVKSLFSNCPKLKDEFQKPEIAAIVRERRARTWNAVIECESFEYEAFYLWSAIAPDLVLQKFTVNESQIKQLGVDADIIESISRNSLYRDHPINFGSVLAPTPKEIKDAHIQ